MVKKPKSFEDAIIDIIAEEFDIPREVLTAPVKGTYTAHQEYLKFYFPPDGTPAW